jgi:hypothetical protein
MHTNGSRQALVDPADYSVRLIYQGRAVCGGTSDNMSLFKTLQVRNGEVYIYSQGRTHRMVPGYGF